MACEGVAMTRKEERRDASESDAVSGQRVDPTLCCVAGWSNYRSKAETLEWGS